MSIPSVPMSQAVPVAALLAACWPTQPAPAPPRSLSELQAACDQLRPDFAACAELANRRLEAGEFADAIGPLGYVCSQNASACVTLGHIYLEGRPGVPADHDKAFKYMDRACVGPNKDYNGCGWSFLRDLTLGDLSWNARDAIEIGVNTTCRYGDVGWPCYNYGVGLACGFFGPPDVTYARHVLQRGCRLGDGRACTLFQQLDGDSPDLPSCDLMGPDPDHPIQLELHTDPMPADAVWPEGKERFKREMMP